MRLLAFIVGFFFFAQVSAQEVSYEQTRLMSQAISADSRFDASLRMCPADRFRSEFGAAYRQKTKTAPKWKQCQKDWAVCFNACASGSGLSCFRTARLLQRAPAIYDRTDVQRLFAFGCLAGDRASCTNRGAGLRNGTYKNDDWGLEGDVRPQCQAALFRRACRKGPGRRGKGWGCAMLAQAYQNGEGVAADVERAKQLYSDVIETTCPLPEDETVARQRSRHPACLFAERKLRTIDGQGQ